jgi:uncharacterized membrane protein
VAFCIWISWQLRLKSKEFQEALEKDASLLAQKLSLINIIGQ